eukprot:9726183-Prorocentrum_lima.AAC.1
MSAEIVEPYWYPDQPPMETSELLQGLFQLHQGELQHQEPTQFWDDDFLHTPNGRQMVPVHEE